MGVFLTPEMDRRFTYPLMFGASRFAMYQIESRAQYPYRVKMRNSSSHLEGYCTIAIVLSKGGALKSPFGENHTAQWDGILPPHLPR